MSCQLTPVRMPVIQEDINDRCWQGCGEAGTLRCCWWKLNVNMAPKESSLEGLRKLKIEIPGVHSVVYDPTILSIYLKKMKTPI